MSLYPTLEAAQAGMDGAKAAIAAVVAVQMPVFTVASNAYDDLLAAHDGSTPPVPPVTYLVFNATGYALSVDGINAQGQPEGSPFTVANHEFFAIQSGSGFNGRAVDAGSNAYTGTIVVGGPTTVTLGDFPALAAAPTSFTLEGDYFAALAEHSGNCVLNTINGTANGTTCATLADLAAAVAAALHLPCTDKNGAGVTLQVTGAQSNEPVVLNITVLASMETTDNVTLNPVY